LDLEHQYPGSHSEGRTKHEALPCLRVVVHNDCQRPNHATYGISGGRRGANGDVIREQLAGKTYTVKPSDGTTWRLEFKADGYAFLDTSRGYRDSGKWRIDVNSWCIELQKSGLACSELRRKGDVFYYRRISNGEIVPMTVR